MLSESVNVRSFEGLKFYFSPCGIGLGHVGRTLPIANELESRGSEIIFSTYLDGLDFVKRQGFPVVSSPALNLITDSTGKVDLRGLSVKQGMIAIPRFLSQVTAEMEYMKAFEPDLVICDTRLSSVFAGKLLGLPVALILNQFQPMIPRSKRYLNLSKIADGGIMTVIGKGWAFSDLILVPDFPEPYTICIDSLRIPRPYKRKVRYVGPILNKKLEKKKNVEKIRKEVGVKGNQRLIYAAISGPKEERIHLINSLKSILTKFPDNYKIVMSKGEPDGDSETIKSGNLIEIPWIKNPYDYFKSCDLVICRGGHTAILQSIYYGKPSIIIPTPNHTEQYANARRAKELGVAEAIHQASLSLDRLVKLSDEVLASDGYKNSLKNIGSKVSFSGVENSINSIMEILGK
jgi:uncharacterized protein (TIGR00661 family)